MGWQRFWKGYDDTMWWNMDYSFCSLYIELLTQLKNKSYGYPAEFTYEEWGEVLEMMIYHLKERSRLFEDDLDKSEYHKEEFFKLFSKYFSNLWD